MSDFSLFLVLRKENKQNSDMTWQRYKLNLRNSLLLEDYFRVMEQFDSTLSSVIDSTVAPRLMMRRRILLVVGANSLLRSLPLVVRLPSRRICNPAGRIISVAIAFLFELP